MLSHLPQDLVDAIVDYVDSDSLKSCASVSTAFLDPCRRRIFRSISLSPNGNERHILSFRRVHSALTGTSPHIAQYIRNVSVWFVTPISLSEPDPHLEVILCSLPRIECLVLRGPLSIGTEISTPEISGRLLVTVSHLLAVPSFNRLYLLYLGASNVFMARAISCARTLLLDLVCIIHTAPGADDPVVDLPRLEHLILPAHQDLQPHIHDALDFLINGNLLQRLRRLTLGMTFDPAGQAHRLLAHTSQTLEDLVIHHGARPAFALSLPRLPVLQSLELSIYLGFRRLLPPDLYLTVAALPPWAAGSPFALFDTSATYQTALPHLRCVRFRLLFPNQERQVHAPAVAANFRELVAAMEAQLPALRELDRYIFLVCTVVSPLDGPIQKKAMVLPLFPLCLRLLFLLCIG
ncbi:hypothetical protein C8R44DRAFT_852485 [Mycena epipterygia]|nr:hypothetical protein C8R44DRAFT_852485 [Mycena epipterygia]